MAGKTKMELDPQEQIIFDLLAKLKNADGSYPKKLMASRRHIYLDQIANIGLGLGIGAGLQNVAKASKSGASRPPVSAIPASSLFETILVAAIIMEAGIAAYTYRDKFAELFTSFSSAPNVEEVAPQTAIESPLPEIIMSESLSATETPTVTSSITLTTPSTGEQPAGNGTSGENIATATPSPNDNNGNHFGQTPRPPIATKAKNSKIPTKNKP